MPYSWAFPEIRKNFLEKPTGKEKNLKIRALTEKTKNLITLLTHCAERLDF